LRALGERTSLAVYVAGDGVAVERVSRVVHLLGAQLRRPAADGTFLVEVCRPEGVALCALAGTPSEDVPPSFEANDEIDAAIASLAGPEPIVDEPLVRAPLLGRLLLAVVKSGDRALPTLLTHLRSRKHAFALIATRSESGEAAIAPRAWPGLGQALAAYTDALSLHRAARDLGLRPGSYRMAAMPPSKLFSWAASLDTSLALGVYEQQPDGTMAPWYVPFRAADLRKMIP
jgi:hypothetical protein